MTDPRPEVVLGHTSVSTPIVETTGTHNRKSIIPQFGSAEYQDSVPSSDESAYTADTHSDVHNVVAPSSFSRPTRKSATSSHYPATIASQRTTAIGLQPFADQAPAMPRFASPLQSNPQRAVGSPQQGSSSSAEVSPVPENSSSPKGSDGDRVVSPLPAIYHSPSDTEPIHYALDQITRDQDARGLNIAGVGGSARGYNSARGQDAQAYRIPMSPDQDLYAAPSHIVPAHSPGGISPRLAQTQPTISGPDKLVAVEASEYPGLPPLNYKPPILRPLGLCLFIFLLMLYMAALIFTAVYSQTHSYIWSYTDFGGPRYFIFQYLPTLIGTVILLWLFEIEIALYRIAPFMALASEQHRARSRGALLPIYPSGFVLPTFVHFAAGQTAIGLFLFASWLAVFTIPLLATSYNVYNQGGATGWVWLATQGIIWSAIALYAILLLASLLLLFSLWRRPQTGLKWDPRSLADILVLLENSNLMTDYARFTGVEVSRGGKTENETLTPREFRDRAERGNHGLGYWRSANSPKEVFHTLGENHLGVRTYTPDDGGISPGPSPQALPGRDPESGRPISYSLGAFGGSRRSMTQHDIDEYLPWFLRPLATIFWALSALLLLIGFLVVSYLPSTAVHSGFVPNLPVPVDVAGYSADNFLYSFIPSLLGLFCLLFWYSIDLNLRRLQLFASLSTAGGELAERSILQSYVSDGLFLIALKAFSHRHVRLSLISLNTLIASALPVLAGGVFWAQFLVPEQTVRITGHMPAFYALSALLCIYALSYWLLPISSRTAQRYSVPNPARQSTGRTNRARSLIEMIALVYHSRILDDYAFRTQVDTRAQLVARLLSVEKSISSPIPMEERVNPDLSPRLDRTALRRGIGSVPRYGIGTLVRNAKSGEPKLAIDRVKREVERRGIERREVLVMNVRTLGK